MSALAEALVAAQRPQDEPPRVLLVPCLACNREAGEPMCTLCDAMTRAEEEAEQDPRERLYGGRAMTAREPWFAALREWWREDRRVYLHRDWRWGWKGHGWNGLHLGVVTVWFASGPSPLARLKRRPANSQSGAGA